MLLAEACPGMSSDELEQLSIGRRNECLLTLREWTFGPQLNSCMKCNSCDESLETSFSVADILKTSSSLLLTTLMETKEGGKELTLKVSDYDVHFRLPNSLDLATISGNEDIASVQCVIFERCITVARRNGEEISVDTLPINVRDAIVDHMEKSDPYAEIHLDLSCPICSHKWESNFDILQFFWSEINAWALRILREVHNLARAYGWREIDILTMSAWRRQFYLEMLK